MQGSRLQLSFGRESVADCVPVTIWDGAPTPACSALPHSLHSAIFARAICYSASFKGIGRCELNSLKAATLHCSCVASHVERQSALAVQQQPGWACGVCHHHSQRTGHWRLHLHCSTGTFSAQERLAPAAHVLMPLGCLQVRPAVLFRSVVTSIARRATTSCGTFVWQTCQNCCTGKCIVRSMVMPVRSRARQLYVAATQLLAAFISCHRHVPSASTSSPSVPTGICMQVPA